MENIIILGDQKNKLSIMLRALYPDFLVQNSKKNTNINFLIILQKEDKELIKNSFMTLDNDAHIIINNDIEDIIDEKYLQGRNVVKFGFAENSDFLATDFNRTDQSCSFKLNYKGNSVPVWLKEDSDKNDAYLALSALCTGVLLGFNLIEVSQKIKNCK